MAGRGLTVLSASLALICGAAFAVAAYLGTTDSAVQKKAANDPAAERKPRKSASRTDQSRGEVSEPENTRYAAIWSAFMRYRRVWFWAVAVCFAIFAVRSFCWLLYIDGSDLKIQSPNNLGDLSLHITLIKNFANGVPLWPDNPIYAHSNVRYPAGIDLFNALLYLVHVDLITGFVWVGLVASLATFYAFFRWGGTFGVAGFLFNGGIAGFQFFTTLKFLDYQGGNKIAWKSIPLSMFVTQRGWLYAIPAGLLLLWHWREKFFCEASVANVDSAAVASAEADDSGTNQPRQPKGPLPFWVELSLYASMPLFHLHTFLALTIVLLFGLVLERPSELGFIANLAPNQAQAPQSVRRQRSTP
jgi:hypothetical protein